MVFYLHNAHDTISRIASELSNLSKSTYPTEVYLEAIRDCQKEWYQDIIKDDIQDIINYDCDAEEKIEGIKQRIKDLK